MLCTQLAGIPAELAEELLLLVEVVHHKVRRVALYGCVVLHSLKGSGGLCCAPRLLADLGFHKQKQVEELRLFVVINQKVLQL